MTELEAFAGDLAAPVAYDEEAHVQRVMGQLDSPRDRARQARVKELYATNQLKTGIDYYHAAMVLQHGEVPEDFLLAHRILRRNQGTERVNIAFATALKPNRQTVFVPPRSSGLSPFHWKSRTVANSATHLRTCQSNINHSRFFALI